MCRLTAIFCLIIASLLSVVVPSTSNAAEWIDDLQVLEVGGWATGNTTFYIKVDKLIGPTECKSELIKIDLGVDSDNEKALLAKSQIRAFALTALTSKLKIKVHTVDTCLYGNPSIDIVYLKSN